VVEGPVGVHYVVPIPEFSELILDGVGDFGGRVGAGAEVAIAFEVGLGGDVVGVQGDGLVKADGGLREVSEVEALELDAPVIEGAGIKGGELDGAGAGFGDEAQFPA
jgi:hypothetical protein